MSFLNQLVRIVVNMITIPSLSPCNKLVVLGLLTGTLKTGLNA